VADAFLDTTFLIDLYRRDEGAVRVWNRVVAGELEVAYSPIAVLEIWLGNFSSGEQRFYEDVLLLAEEVPLRSSAAKSAAENLRKLQPVAERIVRDALIAASAKGHGDVILTRNRRDFQQFTDLIDSYS
jgi:predicted nucleic acid-binding protein